VDWILFDTKATSQSLKHVLDREENEFPFSSLRCIYLGGLAKVSEQRMLIFWMLYKARAVRIQN